MDYITGFIEGFGGTFIPQQFLACNGQSLPISQYDTLFSIIGTTYGGDGVTTFNLPNLNGTLPVGANSSGSGNVPLDMTLGQTQGSESVTLTTQEMPSHNHFVNASTNQADQSTPGSNALFSVAYDSGLSLNVNAYANTGTPNVTLNPSTILMDGGSQPHENRMPVLAIQYCICVEGLYPSRN